MVDLTRAQVAQAVAEERVDHFRRALGPFVVSAENTGMPMIFTDETIDRHPVVFANDSFLALTGFERAEILGKGIGVLLEAVTDASTLSVIEAAIDKGLTGTMEAQCRRANGAEYLATVFFTPVPDVNGINRQYFLSFVEVSGRIDRLLKHPEQFIALYEKAPGIIAATEGPDHRFTYANPSYKRLVGRGISIGDRVVDVLPELSGQGFVELLDDAFKTGEAFVGTNMPLRLTGEEGVERVQYVNFVYQPVRDEAGKVAGLFLEGYNVTAERLASEELSLLQGELAHASRVNVMGMMAATLAHELNQPLTAVLNYAGASVRLLDLTSPQARTLAMVLRSIQEAAQRASDVIRNVRELTKRGETLKAEFNLKAAITECVHLLRAGGCPAATIENLTPPDLDVVGDRVQIQQVVINLLRNACDAFDPKVKGRVTLEAAIREGELVVSVTDTGPGLSAKAAENVFNWTDSSKEGGTGLGLAICRTILESHGGRIWLARSGPSGTQFCFSIPAQGIGAADGGLRPAALQPDRLRHDGLRRA